MKRSYGRLMACVLTLSVAGLATSSSCWVPPQPQPLPDPQYLISTGAPRTLTGDQLAQMYTDLLAENLGDQIVEPNVAGGLYINWKELIKRFLANAVESRVITYWGRDKDGNKIELTGMLYLPRLKVLTPRPHRLPIVAYPHGTELQREAVPSRNADDEWVIGALGALVFGYAMAMPDLPGMGGADPNSYHPYCHAKSLAYSVVDMVYAVREAFDRDLREAYAWDGHLYIMGYSEGAYAAMATVKEIQLNLEQYPDLRITGSACMAGPFDLTGAMRTIMVDPNVHYRRPYFLPYMILGYNAVYGGPFDPDVAMAPVLLPDIIQWMNGTLLGDEVTVLIEQRMGVAPGQTVPRFMLNPQWVADQIDDDVYETSEVGRILAENNLWSGWAPNRPMLMLQSPDDDCVPYGNSVKAYDAFVAAGAKKYVTFHPIGKPGQGIDHVEGGMIGLPSALIWFKYFCPKN